VFGDKTATGARALLSTGKPRSTLERFERAFVAELGVKHCIATPGCNPALSALAAAFAFQPGDEIIVSSITDYGSVQGIVKENDIPVFADTEPGSVNIHAPTGTHLAAGRNGDREVRHRGTPAEDSSYAPDRPSSPRKR
jgi:hypothetical protein